MVRSAERRCRNAKVYFRCAPGASRDFVRVLADARTVYVRCLQDFLAGGLDAAPNYWCFETDGVFCNDSQRDIYETVMPDVLRRFLGGENAAVIAYGATGTGKSLTIGGVEKSFEDRGLVFRALERLMALREEARGKMEVTYTMSFVEASNSQVYDLLDENVPAYGSASMKRLSKVVVDDLQTGLEEIFKGEGRRTTSKKTLHDSHALHSVLTIAARCRLKDETRPLQAVSKLHFVDLAGVDTVGNEGSFHKGVAEIGMANVTKAQVEQFVLALIENVTENVSVKRNLNILILYLGDALSHSSQLRLIGHIRTGRRDLMMTLSMLRLGNLVRGLKGKRAVPDFKETEEGKIRHLEKVVKAMRQEMEIQSMISNDGLSRNLTQDRLGHLQRLAEGYLSNKISELVVVSFSDVGTVLNVFKDRFLDLEAKRKEEVDAAYDRALQSLKSSSLKKLPTMKSKDSVTQSQSSKGSRRSLSWKGSKLSGDSKDKIRKGATRDTVRQGLSAKKSPSASTADQRSAKLGPKAARKSLRRSSAASDGKDETPGARDRPLPEDVPGYERVWKEFAADERYGYAKLKSQLDEDEKAAKDMNARYLTEVRSVGDAKRTAESARDALRLVEMGREIVGGGGAKDAEDALKRMERGVAEQQEGLLLLQSELRLQLEVCRRTRKSIDELYERFCLENYKTASPNLQEGTSEEVPGGSLQQQSAGEAGEATAEDLSECYNNLVRYESLKCAMRRQRAKVRARELRNRKWIRSCKP